MELEQWLQALVRINIVARMLSLKNFFTIDQIGEFDFEEVCRTAGRTSGSGSLKLAKVESKSLSPKGQS